MFDTLKYIFLAAITLFVNIFKTYGNSEFNVNKC